MKIFEDILINVFLPLCAPRASILEIGRFYRQLQKSQFFDITGLEKIQWEKLNHLIDNSRNTVAFYEEYKGLGLYEEGKVRDMLAEYPILTKDKIRSAPERMHSYMCSKGKSMRATTGGTTGEPIEIIFNSHRCAMISAAYWRGMSWVGIKPWTRGVNVGAFGSGSWYGRLRQRLINKCVIDVHGKGLEEKTQLAQMLLRFMPDYMESFTSNVLDMGGVCHEAGLRLDRVITTGEMLYAHQRRELERLYNAEVSDYYGCNEVGSMAFDCEKGTKHITDEHVILEVVDKNNNPIWEEPGRILLTDLDNHLTPFIRYEVGDVGIITRELCSCGRELTVLKSLEGRTQDAIINESGGKLSTVFFAGRFKDLQSIHRIQIIQKSINELDLLYEGTSENAESDINVIISEIHARLGAQMIVVPRHVDRVEYSRRGKRRLIIGLNDAGDPSDRLRNSNVVEGELLT